MQITTTKTVTVKEELNFNNLKVVRTNAKDIDSVNILVFYNDKEIGNGHLNNATNFAHVNINEDLFNEDDESEITDYLVDSIENRKISI